MRKATLRAAWAWTLAAAPAAPLFAADPPPPPPPADAPVVVPAAPRPVARARVAPVVIGTHQIDRYAAIADLQRTLQATPDSLSDWIILGELSSEVAADLSGAESARYYRMSREAYERALALSPDKPGLKAAVQFAKDHELGAEEFGQIRDRATRLYLEARRRDLVATGYVPVLRVDTLPPLPGRSLPKAVPGPVAVTTTTTTTPGRAVTPEESSDPDANTANYGARLDYSSPTVSYRPYFVPRGGPYTYRQYTSAYYPPDFIMEKDTGPLPVTAQRFLQDDLLEPGTGAVVPTTPSVVPVVPARP